MTGFSHPHQYILLAGLYDFSLHSLANMQTGSQSSSDCPCYLKMKRKKFSTASTLLLCARPQGSLPCLLSLPKLSAHLWLWLLEADFSVSLSFYIHKAICLPIFLHCIFLVSLFVSSIKLARSLRTTAVFYLSFHGQFLIYSRAHCRHSILFVGWLNGTKYHILTTFCLIPISHPSGAGISGHFSNTGLFINILKMHWMHCWLMHTAQTQDLSTSEA